MLSGEKLSKALIDPHLRKTDRHRSMPVHPLNDTGIPIPPRDLAVSFNALAKFGLKILLHSIPEHYDLNGF